MEAPIRRRTYLQMFEESVSVGENRPMALDRNLRTDLNLQSKLDTYPGGIRLLVCIGMAVPGQ